MKVIIPKITVYSRIITKSGSYDLNNIKDVAITNSTNINIYINGLLLIPNSTYEIGNEVSTIENISFTIVLESQVFTGSIIQVWTKFNSDYIDIIN